MAVVHIETLQSIYMQAKVRERQRAIVLRTQGRSLSEISEIVKVSKSSVSLWVRHLILSDSAKKQVLRRRVEARERSATTNRARVDSKFTQARAYGESVTKNAHINADTRRLMCALLYWCEGTKIRRRELLAFTNSDPELVTAFLHLLRTGFKINEKRLRLVLHIHEYHDAEEQLQFWSKLTKIPRTQCNKPYLKPHTGIRSREGYQGCVSVRYLDVDFGRRLEGIAKVFLQKKGL